MRDHIIPRFLCAVLVMAMVGGCGSANPFNPFQDVSVRVAGTGFGTGAVFANDPAVPLDCQVTPDALIGACDVTFQDAGSGGSFTLTAAADPGSGFLGWQGCSSVAGPVCTLNFSPGSDVTFFVDVIFYPTAPIGGLAKVSGDSQQVRLFTHAPLVVSFRNPDGTPRVGADILWMAEPGGFSVEGSSIVDSAGFASTDIGENGQGEFQHTRITASPAGSPLDQVTFTVFLPHRFRVVSGDSQTAAPGARLPLPITAVFEDPICCSDGPPASFSWLVLTGGGSLDKDTTAWAGPASMSNGWVLGLVAGTQQVRVIRQLAVENLPPDTTIITAFSVPAGGNPVCGTGGTLHVGGVDVTSPETWTAAGSPHIVQGQLRFTVGARLTIDAGAVVCVEPGGYISLSEGLYAVGTPANPIRFTATDTAQGWQGILLGGPATTPFSEISNARFEYAFSAIVAATPIRIDSTIIRQSGNLAIIIQNSSTSNRIFHTTVDTTFGSNPAVLLNAPGTVFVGTIRGAGGTAALMINEDSVTVQDCEINGSGGIGVLVANFQGAVVSNCNITGNAGLAVSGSPVDARSNWWGSAAGPAIGGPNGVSSGVDASNPLSAPATPGFRPVWIRRGSMVRLSRSP